MPELPEVETNARNLAAWAVGRRIVAVTPPPGLREAGGLGPAKFRARLRGRRVESVERRGKWTLARLSGGAGLALHLGMTGKFARVREPGAPLPRFTRAVLALENGVRVCFVDSRRFGKLLAMERWEDVLAIPAVAGLGPDALARSTGAVLQARLGTTRRTIKEALLDQRVVAGVGNLYATEALWRARIHPRTPAPAIVASAALARRLAAAIRAALRHGLGELAGAELPEYLEDGAPNPFHVYDRRGEPCPRCRERIDAIVLGGRTSAFCPRCQPEPAATNARRLSKNSRLRAKRARRAPKARPGRSGRTTRSRG